MKVKDLFIKLATRAGIPEADAKLTALVGQLPDLDVDDESVANPLTANLITQAEAEANPALKKRLTAEALNGVDALLNPVLADFLDQAELDEIKGDKVTTKRLQKLLDKAKAAKQSTGNSAETAKAIETLNNEIAKLKTDKEAEIGSLKSQYERERYYDRLATKVIGRNDVTEYAKAKDGRRVIADLQDTLETVGGVLDHATGKVMQKADPSLPLYIENKAVDVDFVLEKTLKDNDYIKKSDPAPAGKVKTQGADPADSTVSVAAQKNLDRARQAAKTE